MITERLPAMVFTGFQESSHWREETARYRELAGVAHQICIFAGGELPIEQDQHQIHVRLHGPDPLRQEWFLLVLTEQFAAVLCGRDQLAPVPGESDRRFDTLWTFEPALIVRTIELLRAVVARERPDRLDDLDAATARFPPPQPDARLMTLFTTRLINDLTEQQQALPAPRTGAGLRLAPEGARAAGPHQLCGDHLRSADAGHERYGSV